MTMTRRHQNGLSVEIVAAVEHVLRRGLGDDLPGVAHAALRPESVPAAKDAARYARLAKAIYRARRDRDADFGPLGVRFGEPGWDIMLDLYRARHEGSEVSISSACIASGAPPTTGLRHLVALERRGLVERQYDAHDRRRCLVNLSAVGVSSMDKWFSRVVTEDSPVSVFR